MIRKVLIANRGEIALRIIRTCKESGIQSVLVYSTADRDSLPVQMADQAICIGPPESKDSYLNVPSLLSAIEVTDADAVHPGYGFLAENAAFAEICENYGVNFIGPPSSVIRLMGNKIEARKAVASADVPILPGSEGPVVEEEEGLEVAKKIGFPVIIKAAAGGGGRGMKIVHSSATFINAFLTAQSEALAAFGLPDVYIEKYFENARHVEVQVLADSSGNTIHLGDRDCSVQRRHQKLLEEAMAPGIPARVRKKMHSSAVEVAEAVGYVSAGTVEFLYVPGKNFYFLEMNTRIQVEHPVTEMITGVDLIKEQLKIADGKKLKIKQDDVQFRGHAIECRINAEDPKKFMPSPGLVKTCYLPGGYGVRVDSAVINGYIIPATYDSLIAKVISWGEDRKEAIARMRRALDEIVFEGVQTTVSFHKKILNDPDFVEGKLSTRFIEKFGGS
ncbi:MAG: acetyl-CoA carboxylase biotin carboxylase subunit [Deltaproteobacteria bacterium]|nr:acetyl-CoA carboxylase biotin carboxylase subunit [Deltaproteobacteria bacterium]NIS76620.1 acetyl-CoA carboxylase biotin carboxylase subunit [Deltaproteobacteria bacterium]